MLFRHLCRELYRISLYNIEKRSSFRVPFFGFLFLIYIRKYIEIMAGINGVGRVGIRNYVAPTTSLSSIIANGLVLNLDAGNALSYPGTGTVWTDLSVNGNNATLINGTSYSSVSGGALVFDGVNDYTEQIIPFSPSFTIFIWVYPISGTGIMLYGQSGSHPIMLLDYNTSGNLRVYVSDYYQTYSSALTLNRWNLISVVASESSSTREVFVNGISKGSGGYSPNSQVGLFRLGVQNFAGHGNCRIGQASVYNRALTSAEVLQNFNSTKSRFGFAAPAPVQSYMLDTYGGASAGYSLRRLSSAYAGSAIRVRRSSDNTEMNIGFDSSGNLDTTSLTSFVGSGNGFVTTWYDQSGLGRDAIQPTASQQPEIVISGAINTLNGKPAIKFIDYLSRYLYVNSNTILNIQDCISTFSVANFVNNGGNYGMIMSKGYGIDGVYSLSQQANGSNYLQLNIETNGFLSPTITNKNQQYLFSNTNATGANGIKLYQNNSLIIQATTTNDLAGSNSYYFNIGRNNRDNSYYIDGNIQEIVCYPTYQQTNLSPINTNINTYYSIY